VGGLGGVGGSKPCKRKGKNTGTTKKGGPWHRDKESVKKGGVEKDNSGRIEPQRRNQEGVKNRKIQTQPKPGGPAGVTPQNIARVFRHVGKNKRFRGSEGFGWKGFGVAKVAYATLRTSKGTQERGLSERQR